MILFQNQAQLLTRESLRILQIRFIHEISPLPAKACDCFLRSSKETVIYKTKIREEIKTYTSISILSDTKYVFQQKYIPKAQGC